MTIKFLTMSEILSSEEKEALSKAVDNYKREHPLCELNPNVDYAEYVVKNLNAKRQSSNVEKGEQVIDPCLAQKKPKCEVSEDNLATTSNEKPSSSSFSAVCPTSLMVLQNEASECCSQMEAFNEAFKSRNSVWYTPYKEDIYNYYRGKEPFFLPKPDYMVWQKDLNMGMRSLIIDWLVRIAEEFNMCTETLYLAVSYIDRFLSNASVDKELLQLLGLTSLFIASKYEESHIHELEEFVSITSNTCTKQQILSTELTILKKLDFHLSIPTAYTFLQIYLSICKPHYFVFHNAEYLCELSLIDGVFLKYPPSLVAAGAVVFASISGGCNLWDKTMESFTGYKLADIEEVLELFYMIKEEEKLNPHNEAIIEKYKSVNHAFVSFHNA